MADIVIRRTEENEITGEFINREFSSYSTSKEVDLNYDEFCFTASDETGKLIGVITGRAYYNEIHIGDLIVDGNVRRGGIGSISRQGIYEDNSYHLRLPGSRILQEAGL